MSASIASRSKGGLRVPALRILSSNVTDAERVSFIRSHIAAIKRCGQRTIQHTWLVGRELVYIKGQRKDLRGRTWNSYVKKHFDIGEMQAYSLMRVYRGFPSLKAIPQSVGSVRAAIDHLKGVRPARAKSRRHDQLRVARQRLVEIADADPAAFRKLLAAIRREHAKLLG